jgi:hypothetical protein
MSAPVFLNTAHWRLALSLVVIMYDTDVGKQLIFQPAVLSD